MTSPPRKKAGRPAGGAAISRERIVEVALALIDEAGLGALTMRDIAARLQVYPASVQWHVKTKDDLLAAVAGSVMADISVPADDMPWQAWIVALFRRCRQAVRRHPNVTPLIGAQLVSNASLPADLVDGVLRTLERAGFADESLLEAYNTVIAAMLGFLTMEFAPLPAENPQRWADELRERVHTVRPLDHPSLARALPVLANRAFIVRWENGVTAPMDASFERHAAIIVAGLDAFARAQRQTAG
ncbi:TetR/AcrR family transcriptional regulator C-terminal domain-containing protein [Achromobacter sp. GG226]|uniref:TetR/AcrR family transcriptional regulator n=1 Tax=Verticiella alkaliphila TaxID=2779529 RepID=UPI001C0BCBD5|nr:TetR family transcriptional regulator [Verticiella sp. GG226]MBU4610784.1 TetR/AcrR family transcriptional regulator C-terminal domain-containing protein [Verticiella sp. GG226]